MTDSEAIRLERISQLNSQITTLRSELMLLERQQRDLEDDRGAVMNLNDIEKSIGDGKPWFGTMNLFIEWCKANSDKPYFEWNGGVFPMNATSWDQKLTTIAALERKAANESEG